MSSARDLQLAIRGFRRSPAFFLTAATILAVGIGLSVVIFTVFRTVFVRRLPVREQDRVVVMWTYREPSTDFTLPPRELGDIRTASRTMTDIATTVHWGAVPGPFVDGDRTLALRYGLVSGNFFDVLGARPVIGRLLSPSDDDATEAPPFGPGVSKNVVISYRTWRKVFAGDTSILGHHLINGLTKWGYTIVGVAPPGLDYPRGVELWEPMRGGWKSYNSAFIVGRLAPGATLAAARDEYLGLSNRADPLLRAKGVHAETFVDAVVGNVKTVVALLTAAVGLLLLITCLNVGNLLLLRASGRAREIAVRRALGATYADIARQLIVEATLLAWAGGVAGFVIAAALLRVLPSVAPRNLPRLTEIQLAGAPVLATIGISSFALLLFGVVPALDAARSNVASTLRFHSRAGGGTRRRRALRHTLIASQIAVAMIMLSGAGLLARSLTQLEGQDPGYIADHLSILEYTWDVQSANTADKLREVARRIQSRIAAIPGVIASTPIVVPPLLGTGVWQIRFGKEGQSNAESQTNPTFPADVIGPGYFKTFGIPIVRGRAFTDEDGLGSPLVIIVSESFARRFWPGQNAVGQRLRVPGMTSGTLVGDSAWRTVVGVGGDAHLRDVREATPMAFIPVTQGYWQGVFAIRNTVPTSTLMPALRAAGRDAASGVALWKADSMDELLNDPLSEPRVSALLMSAFGIVAVFLAAIGLYGVMAAAVREQTREFGIRIALGATSGHVLTDVLSQAAIVAGIGAGVGLIAALAVSRFFTTLLFRVSPTDPLALGGACGVLVVVAGIAAYVPARRATTIDPIEALRAD